MADNVCLVVGAGDALGGAIAKRFAREGYTACVVRRNADRLGPLVEAIEAEGGRAVPFGVDARKEDEVIELVAGIERDIGPIEAGIYNVGGNIRFPIREFTQRKYFKVWEMGALAGFFTGRELARVMVPRGEGTIVFTGATASVRGAEGFAGFAGAKHALRALAQSMARELGREGVHVAHVVIDGPIDTQFTRANFPDFFEDPRPDRVLKPEDIAENYWTLHTQPRSAWTFEMDLRPWVEPW
jgi:NAD(P)-dependent dehydrogenase (short-subunit alcohol dehydrogenase family)